MKFRLYRPISLFLLLFFTVCSMAAVVEKSDAEKAARNFFFERLNQKAQTAFEKTAISGTYTITAAGLPAYYAVNFSRGGFVLITADDILRPIIGYSTEGSYSPDNQPETFRGWMEEIKSQVVYYRENNFLADATIRNNWKYLLDENFSAKPVAKDSKDVEPFMLSNWDQDKFYNTLCPDDPAGPEGHALTGCVATAMSQVIYYYRYPETGMGTHGYWANNPTGNPNYGNYGFLSVNFGASTYNYDEMVNQPNEANLEIAKLNYHCGVAVNMNFGPTASGAFTQDCPGALINYFRYHSACSFKQRFSYTTAQWEGMIMADHDLKRPVMYSGRNSSYGHCFITDGYQITGNGNMFHFNWGWSGNYNGYFSVDNLNPGGDPPFSQSQGLVTNIYPANTFPYQCTGQKVLTGTKGTIDDGSSHLANYLDNANCSWLIAPADSVKKITLTFNKFDTEAANDIVTVYDGDNTSAPVLLTHSGTTLPASPVISTTNRMLITFTSNGSVTAPGFFATYKSTYPTFCSGTTLTAAQGTVTDGSGPVNYNNNSTCTWIIQPTGATSVTLTFTSFDTEPVKDFVKVYDLVTQNLLGTYSGNTLPAPVTSPSGQMYIEFKSNYVYTYGGWSADYSAGNIGFGEIDGFEKLSVYPNPAGTTLNYDFRLTNPGTLALEILSLTGEVLYSGTSGKNQVFTGVIDLTGYAKGLYLMRLRTDQASYTEKLIIQ